jgi:hypothetical protein
MATRASEVLSPAVKVVKMDFIVSGQPVVEMNVMDRSRPYVETNVEKNVNGRTEGTTGMANLNRYRENQ